MKSNHGNGTFSWAFCSHGRKRIDLKKMGWERFLLMGFPGPIRGRIGGKRGEMGKMGKIGVGAFVIAKW